MTAGDMARRRLYDSVAKPRADGGGTPRPERPVGIAAVFGATIAALIIVALTGIAELSYLVVLGGIVLATAGVTIAIGVSTPPRRRSPIPSSRRRSGS